MPRRAKILRFPGVAANPDATSSPTDQRSDEETLVEAYRCNGSEALVVRGLLESHGIRAVLRSRIAHSVHPFTVGDQGEVIVLVAEPQAVRARRLLTRRVSEA